VVTKGMEPILTGSYQGMVQLFKEGESGGWMSPLTVATKVVLELSIWLKVSREWWETVLPKVSLTRNA